MITCVLVNEKIIVVNACIKSFVPCLEPVSDTDDGGKYDVAECQALYLCDSIKHANKG